MKLNIILKVLINILIITVFQYGAASTLYYIDHNIDMLLGIILSCAIAFPMSFLTGMGLFNENSK